MPVVSAKEVVESFDFSEYEHIFPEETKTALSEVFSARKRGWKSRAVKVVEISKLYKKLDTRSAELKELMTLERKGRNPENDARNALRKFINSLSETKLQELCTQKGVSYSSFAGDKVNLIEAIIDEMLTVD